jgi:hypothetical protein
MVALFTLLWLVAVGIYLYGAWWFLRRAVTTDKWVQWLGAMALWTLLGPALIVVIGTTS